MAVRCEEYDGVCVMTVTGDFAGADVAPARKHAADLIDQRQVVNFVVDLERTTFVDSEGLEALLWIKQRSEDHFGRFKLAAAATGVKKILEVTRLSHRFETAADVPMALKMMR